MATALAPGFRFSGDARHKLSYGQVKRLAQAFGLPGDAIAQIAKGESSSYADVQQRDPGDGMVGYGLLQMTPNAWGKGSAAYRYMQKLGGVGALRDPVKNMAMARFLYKSAGNKLTPWYGTKYLTNRSGEGRLGPVDRTLVPHLGSAGATLNITTPRHLALNATPATLTDQTLPQRPQRQITAPPLASFAAQPVTSAAPTTQPQTAETAQTAQTPVRFQAGAALEALNRLAQPSGGTSVIGGDTVQTKTPGSGGGNYKAGGARGSKVLELIHNDGGKGYGIKDGQIVNAPQVFSGVWAGHANHVHVAAGPQTIVALGKLAQSMGLHVGENPHFGGVNPVHAANSYHYKGEAIDVSGSSALMNRYSRAVERYNRTHRLPSV